MTTPLDNVCNICYEELCKEITASLEPCKHKFCQSCLSEALLTDELCPIDRNKNISITIWDDKTLRMNTITTSRFLLDFLTNKAKQLETKLKDFIVFLCENIFTQCQTGLAFTENYSKERQSTHVWEKKNVDIWRDKYRDVLEYNYMFEEIECQYHELKKEYNDLYTQFNIASFGNSFFIKPIMENVNFYFNISATNTRTLLYIFYNWIARDGNKVSGLIDIEKKYKRKPSFSLQIIKTSPNLSVPDIINCMIRKSSEDTVFFMNGDWYDDRRGYARDLYRKIDKLFEI
jgi:hypothetical protein